MPCKKCEYIIYIYIYTEKNAISYYACLNTLGMRQNRVSTWQYNRTPHLYTSINEIDHK